MRKINLFIACIMAIIFAVLVFQRCSKEKIDNANIESQQDQDEYFLIKKIHRFIDLAEQNRNGLSLKSGEKVTLDSAFFYIDATFNYTYCFSTSEYNKMHWDTTYTEFPVDTESEVLFDDVLIAYNDAVDKVRLKYRAISDTTKKLVAVVFENMGIEYDTNQKIRIIPQIGIVSSISSILSPSGNFSIDDEYWFLRDSYKCDYSGEIGAPNVIEDNINFKFRPAPQPNCHVWFTDSEIYTPMHIDFPSGNTINNYCDYLIFYAISTFETITDDTRCLGYNQYQQGIHEMDFYLDGADYIITNWLYDNTLNPDNKSFESFVINSYHYYDITNDIEEIGHEHNITFGIYHIICWQQAQDYPISIN